MNHGDSLMITDLAQKAATDAVEAIERVAALLDNPAHRCAVKAVALAALQAVSEQAIGPEQGPIRALHQMSLATFRRHGVAGVGAAVSG